MCSPATRPGGASTRPRWPSPPTAFNRLFSNDNPLLRAARDAGMGLVQAAPALRRRFIREAAGLTGDLPRLLQGRAL
jgi:2-octaprenyl-6-methoxyphenol hydroxylase